MECKNILENDLHEKYLLGRLGEPERMEYESHIHQCESCRVELQNQRRVIAAIKEVGCEEMKKEIRRRVEIREAVRADIRWSKLSKIAAVLLLFIMTPTIIYFVQKEKPELMKTSVPRIQDDARVAAGGAPPAEVTEEKLDVQESEVPREERQLTEVPPLAEVSRDASVSGEDIVELPPQPQKIIGVPLPGETGISEIENERKSAVMSVPEDTETPEDQGGGPPGSAGEAVPVGTYVFHEAGGHADTEGTPVSHLKPYSIGEESVTGETQVWRFVSNRSVIDVHLVGFYEGDAADIDGGAAAGTLPEAIPIEIVTRDSLGMDMKWMVGTVFSEITPAEMKLVVFSDQTMRIVLQDSIMYRTDLKSDKSRAILEQ